VQGNKVTAHVAAAVVFAAILACMPGMASAAFSSSTRASLTSTVAELGAPVPGPPATQTCTPQGSGPTRSFINVITVKPFSAAAGATGYELRVLKPGGQLAGSSTGTAAGGGSVTVTLTGADSASGWTYVIRANRMFNATNTWTKDSAADTAPVSNTNGTCK
jgi:hypothetical protein